MDGPSGISPLAASPDATRVPSSWAGTSGGPKARGQATEPTISEGRGWRVGPSVRAVERTSDVECATPGSISSRRCRRSWRGMVAGGGRGLGGNG